MPATKRAQRTRHVPLRTCVACRSTEAKRGLVRVVRTPEGRVALDPTGKQNGRGAYVHESRACWDQALKRGRLAHSLKVTIAPEDQALLEQHVATLPESVPEAEEKEI